MKIRKSSERGHISHGWLDTYHTFSFADYYDPRWMGYRSLRVLNDDIVMPGRGFATHPHQNMEILTYVLRGNLEHKDSMGNGRVIQPGEVQYMSAGSGVRHSEFNPSRDEAVQLLQIWIEPNEFGLPPRYDQRSFQDQPPGVFRLIASPDGRDGSIAIRQDASLWVAKLSPGDRLAHPLAPGRHAWVHIAEGAVTLNGQPLQAGDAAAFDHPDLPEFTAVKPSTVLFFDLN